MISADATALYSAALPFVMPWQTLEPHLEVISLDGVEPAWERLLAGQGIDLRQGSDQVPEDCTVAAGFDKLDGLTPQTFKPWAATAVLALRPGGLLVLGGIDPQSGLGGGGLAPAEAARILLAAGFARVRLLYPPLHPEDTSLLSALNGSGERYAVVAQTAATGKAFDIFSTVFATAPLHPQQDRLRRAEAALHHQMHHNTHQVETNLRQRLDQAETALHEQRLEIAGMHAALAEMTRLTRRRGLRKLVYQLKQKWRARRPEKTPPAVQPDQTALPADTYQPTVPSGQELARPSADPMPLSAREAAVRHQLFDHKDT